MDKPDVTQADIDTWNALCQLIFNSDLSGPEAAARHRQAATLEGIRMGLEAAAKWEPIETAPKDGTAILLGYFRENLDGTIYQEGGQPVVASWVPHRHARKDGQEAHWVARNERLLSGDGRPFTPSHWMSLPEFGALDPATVLREHRETNND